MEKQRGVANEPDRSSPIVAAAAADDDDIDNGLLRLRLPLPSAHCGGGGGGGGVVVVVVVDDDDDDDWSKKKNPYCQ